MPVHDIKCRYCSNIDRKYVDVGKMGHLQCERCDGWDVFIYYGNWDGSNICGTQYYTSCANGNVPMTSGDIDKKCKTEGLVYGDHKELAREADRYKYEKKKETDKRNRKVAVDIYKTFKDNGCYS